MVKPLTEWTIVVATVVVATTAVLATDVASGHHLGTNIGKFIAQSSSGIAETEREEGER